MNLPVLTYHSIDDSQSVISTPPAVFTRQMEYLWQQGYQTISAAELVAAIQGSFKPPEKSVLLTFDDGYENLYSEAFPVLERLRFKAIVFLITDYCGKLNEWSDGAASLARRQMLSWSQIKEMSKYNIEFGAHTATHADLTKLTPTQAAEEMVKSKVTIQEVLGLESRTFAYPYGKMNALVKETAQQHFAAAFSTRLGKVNRLCDLHLIRRVDMYYLQNEAIFRALSSTPFDWYLGLRQALRDVKSYFA